METMADPNSIDIQPEIKWHMRPFLLDFMIEGHFMYHLLPETLFLAVNILDRYCSKRIVYKKHYQLVGTTALWIAAKYGECKDKVPTIANLKFLCDGLYDDQLYTQVEWHMLQTLEWVIGHPTVDSFIQICRDGVMVDLELEHMARYILEISLYHREFIGKNSSEVARASMALARIILGRDPAGPYDWESDYSEQTLQAFSLMVKSPPQVVARKYASAHLARVSMVLEDFLKKRAALDKAYETQMLMQACEMKPAPVAENVSPSTYVYATPQKNQYPANMPPTPPITPGTECFSMKNPGLSRPRPMTPTTGPRMSVHPEMVY